jgi:hypothetical protein
MPHTSKSSNGLDKLKKKAEQPKKYKSNKDWLNQRIKEVRTPIKEFGSV